MGSQEGVQSLTQIKNEEMPKHLLLRNYNDLICDITFQASSDCIDS